MDIKDLIIDGFTISYVFDAGTGRKSSHFVSANFKLPVPCHIDEVELVRLEASRHVTAWAIQDAVMRAEISSNDAAERMQIVRGNFDGMKATIEKKAAERK